MGIVTGGKKSRVKGGIVMGCKKSQGKTVRFMLPLHPVGSYECPMDLEMNTPEIDETAVAQDRSSFNGSACVRSKKYLLAVLLGLFLCAWISWIAWLLKA